MIRRQFLSLTATGVTAAAFNGVVGSASAKAEDAQQGAPKRKRPILNQFHRGAGNYRPENTLETFLWAWGSGGIPEADARFTADKVAIACHDADLARCSHGVPESMKKTPIAELTWEQIRDVNIGEYRGEAFKTEKIPTMESVFACMKGRPDRMLYIDEKGMPPKLMAEMSESYGVQEQIIFASSRYDIIKEWKKTAPKAKSIHWIPTLRDPVPAVEKLTPYLEMLDKASFEGIDICQIHTFCDFSRPDPYSPTSEFLRHAGETMKKHGVIFQSLSWTNGDKAETYYGLIDLGVESFATDYPIEFMVAIEKLEP